MTVKALTSGGIIIETDDAQRIVITDKEVSGLRAALELVEARREEEKAGR